MHSLPVYAATDQKIHPTQHCAVTP
jgi:hypothetical protein